MLNFPKISMIRFPKLFLHSILLVIVLTFASLLGTDIVGWIIGSPVESSKQIVFFITIIWVFFAVQNKKYQIAEK